MPFELRLSRFLGFPLFILGGTLVTAGASQAACAFTPTAGDDAYICDSGIDPGGLSDPGGNNSLTMPENGTGIIDGPVDFLGNGVDTIAIHSGEIRGAVSQRDGIDDFLMTGGVIGSLQQGGDYDNFRMTGGTIKGAFEDGDYAEMTGGTIGRVDMKLANNFFYLSGGTIQGNLVAGFGKDTIDVSGGVIGGNISVSGGDDVIHVTGGEIAGEIRASFGNDKFTWENGGAIFSDVLLGSDDDIATISGLSESTLSVTPHVDGGDGNDVLVFDGTQSENGSRYTSFEAARLTNGSVFTLDDRPFVLGDAGTLTGSFGIDESSRLYVDGNAAISPFGAGLALVQNAGTIDMHHTAGTPTDSLTINGDYAGLGGSVVLDTYLGNDTSPSDKLVIAGGNASGLTGLDILNAGGPGAGTAGNGILVVETTNGGTTDDGAFALDRAVAAGAHEYLLFKGGTTAGTGENWYLRSNLITVPTPPPPVEPPAPPPPPPAPPPPPPEEPPPAPPVVTPPADPGAPVADVPGDPPAAPPVVPPVPSNPVEPDPTFPEGVAEPVPVVEPIPVPDPAGADRFAVVAPTSDARLPDADLLAGAAAIPLYRLEAATYTVVPVAAYRLGLVTLGTLDERRGGQEMLGDPDQAAWLRVYGQNIRQSWSGTVAPSLDGSVLGVQAGMDLLEFDGANGHTTAGLFIGTAQLRGDLQGFALGWADYDVGTIDLDATQLGAYATYVAPSGWYVDGILMGTWFGGSATSTRDLGIPVSGFGLTASLETGYPIPIGGGWRLEPQGQIIWQGISLDDESDPFSPVTFDRLSGFAGRIGVRLDNEIAIDGGTLKPAVFANLWHDFGTTSTTHLATDALDTENGGTALELGAGFTAEIGDSVNLFGNLSHTFGLGDADRSATRAQLGLQVSF